VTANSTRHRLEPSPTQTTVWLGDRHIGTVFPLVVEPKPGDPPSDWIGRRRGHPGQRFGNEHRALAYVIGRCPDCRCDPERCVPGEVNDTCLDCEACLNGCPENECEMTEEIRR
jgi:hypothetical protein